MTSEAQVFAKDKIKMNILQDVLRGQINISFQLNNGPAKDYASQIHTDGKRVYVFGKFNISEDANEGDTITIRPIMIDAPLKITLHSNGSISGKKASVIRNATKTVEQEYQIIGETTLLELYPQGNQYYTIKLSNGTGVAVPTVQSIPSQPQRKPVPRVMPNPEPVAKPLRPSSPIIEEVVTPIGGSSPLDDRFEGAGLDIGFTGSDNRFESFNPDPISVVGETPHNSSIDRLEEITNRDQEPAVHTLSTNESAPVSQQDDRSLQRIEQEIAVIERQQGQLSRKKQSAIDHLEKIEAEYKKDYDSLKQELEDYKSRMDADASIIEHYKDQDIIPVEIIFQEVRLKLEEAEKQIQFFIEAKQRKTMDIENEIKSNKKQ